MKYFSKIITDGVTGIGNAAKEEDTKNAVFALMLEDGEITVGIGGSMPELSKLLARAMNGDENIRRTVQAAVEVAPLMALFEGIQRANPDGTPMEDEPDTSQEPPATCGCPMCVAKRNQQTRADRDPAAGAPKSKFNPDVN